jgi:AAA family ATP:ADP antiporter
VAFFNELKQVHLTFLNLTKREKLNISLLGSIVFFLLFSYPLVRATTTSLFLTSFGASQSPYVWLYSVLCLGLCVTLYNSLQKDVSIYKLFFMTGLITLIVFLVALWGYFFHSEYWAYVLYIWKEVYIILLIHSIFAFVNLTTPESVAKVIYGPFGALGSMGGILGGVTVTYFSGKFAERDILLFGIFIAFLSTLLIRFVNTRNDKHILNFEKEKKKLSPLASIKNVKGYVFCICLIIMMSQFVINLGNYQFNFYLEEAFPLKSDKTNFLGLTYTYINSLSLTLQFILMPILFRLFSPVTLHFIIPLLFAFFFFISNMWGGMASAFILMKGVDYSIFSGAKELLYFPLGDLQKYGAKYLADMVVYRFSKGLISLILILVPSSGMVGGLFYISVAFWLVALLFLSKLYKKYHGDKYEQPID